MVAHCREQATELLKRGWPAGEEPRYDSDAVLVLCRMRQFQEGLLFLFERMRLFREVLRVILRPKPFYLGPMPCRWSPGGTCICIVTICSVCALIQYRALREMIIKLRALLAVNSRTFQGLKLALPCSDTQSWAIMHPCVLLCISLSSRT